MSLDDGDLLRDAGVEGSNPFTPTIIFLGVFPASLRRITSLVPEENGHWFQNWFQFGSGRFRHPPSRYSLFYTSTRSSAPIRPTCFAGTGKFFATGSMHWSREKIVWSGKSRRTPTTLFSRWIKIGVLERLGNDRAPLPNRPMPVQRDVSPQHFRHDRQSRRIHPFTDQTRTLLSASRTEALYVACRVVASLLLANSLINPQCQLNVLSKRAALVTRFHAEWLHLHRSPVFRAQCQLLSQNSLG